VETVLAGRSHEIKGYTVATRVFGRGQDFNQATDPIVSIQANKLRRALERYYLVAGQNDPIRIEIPKGSYVPLFRATGHRNGAQPFQARRKTDAAPVPMRGPRSWSNRFENLTGRPAQLGYLGIGLANELSLEITRYQEIRVLLMQHREGGQRRAEDMPVPVLS
jgi:adenylate cyclase